MNSMILGGPGVLAAGIASRGTVVIVAVKVLASLLTQIVLVLKAPTSDSRHTASSLLGLLRF